MLIDDARPLRLHDIAEDPRSVGFPANHPPMRSFLGAPVTARGQVYGNLYLTEKRDGEDFDADDERALTLLATQAGVAIENASLYEQAQDRARRLEAVRAITTAILAGTDTGELLSLVVGHARELVGADLATLALPAGTDRLVIEAADGLLSEELRGTTFPMSGSVTGDVLRTGKAVALADASADDRMAQPIVRAGVGPALFIPLAVRGRTLGSLTVANVSGGPPLREAAVQLVETFAEQAAVALEYARLQGELQAAGRARGPRADRQGAARRRHPGPVRGRHGPAGLGPAGHRRRPPRPAPARRRGAGPGHPRPAQLHLRPAPRHPRRPPARPGPPGPGRGVRPAHRRGRHRRDRSGGGGRADRPGRRRGPAGPRGAVQCEPPRRGRHLPGVAVPGRGRRRAGGRRRRPRLRPGADDRRRPGPPQPARAGRGAWAAGPRSTAPPERGPGSGSRSPAELQLPSLVEERQRTASCTSPSWRRVRRAVCFGERPRARGPFGPTILVRLGPLCWHVRSLLHGAAPAGQAGRAGNARLSGRLAVNGCRRSPTARRSPAHRGRGRTAWAQARSASHHPDRPARPLSLHDLAAP